MLICTNSSDSEYKYVDYEVGDVVSHIMSRNKYVVGKIYRKTNRAVVEDAKGRQFEFFATSLIKMRSE